MFQKLSSKLAALVFSVLLVSCGSLKLQETSTEIKAMDKGQKEAGYFNFAIEKNRNQPIEILEVVLIEKETGNRTNMSFTITDLEKKRKLITLAGEENFLIQAKSILDKPLETGFRAEIIYRKGADGKRKVLKVSEISEKAS
jgi:hypothetical protein